AGLVSRGVGGGRGGWGGGWAGGAGLLGSGAGVSAAGLGLSWGAGVGAGFAAGVLAGGGAALAQARGARTSRAARAPKAILFSLSVMGLLDQKKSGEILASSALPRPRPSPLPLSHRTPPDRERGTPASDLAHPCPSLPILVRPLFVRCSSVFVRLSPSSPGWGECEGRRGPG